MTAKKTIWMLLLAFGLPIILGNLFYFFNPNYFSNKTVNYGDLVSPIIVMTQNDFIDNTNVKDLNGKWTLAYYASSCQANCQQILGKIKTIHLLTNDKMKRVQRLLLTQDNQAQIQGVFVGKVNDSFVKKIQSFPAMSLFLIDPLGNIMLRYDGQTLNAKKVLKDLNRLFKYSRIG